MGHHLQLYYYDLRVHLPFLPPRRTKSIPHGMENPRHSSLRRILWIPHPRGGCSESGSAVVGGLE